MSKEPSNEDTDDLVTVAELARITGEKETQIRGRIAKGHYKLGKHYFKRGRSIRLSRRAIREYWSTEK